jgi:aerobic carbon-monoxide dehydrogenase medium subunit
MYPARFDYFRAITIEDAIRLLGAHAGASLLAGGHSLLPMMKLRLATPHAVIDIGRVDELKGIGADGDRIKIGALTTHAELAASPVLRDRCPLVSEAAAKIADPQVRNKGTIAGNLAHADPGSDLPGVVLALDGVVHLAGPRGVRGVDAKKFFTDLLTTDIHEGEVITDVSVRALGKGTGSGYAKFEHPASGYAVCGAAAVVSLGADGKCTSARLCFNGVTATPLDASDAVSALVGSTADDGAIDKAIAQLSIASPRSDVSFSGEYRASLAHTYGKRALKLARDRARG